MTRTRLGLLASGAVVVLVLAVGFAWLVGTGRRWQNGDAANPTVGVAVNGHKVDLEPRAYCTDPDDPTVCVEDAGAVQKLVIPAGSVAWVTVPHIVSEAPWMLTVQYYLPTGDTLEETTQTFYGSGEKGTVLLKSRADRLIATIEIAGPPKAADTNGDFYPTYVWGLDTIDTETAPSETVPAE